MVSKLLVLSAFISLALAKPYPRSMTVLESRESAPATFTRKGAADADSTISLRIALAQNNVNGLIDTLYAVSTPSSATYGEHLTKEEVETFVAPSAATVDAVNAWLKEAGIVAQTISPAGDWLSINVPVSKANELLNANFEVYTHSSGQEAIRTLSYSIPNELLGHVELVHPTVTFANPRARLPVVKAAVQPLRGGGGGGGGSSGSTCSSSGITPACVQSLYGVPTTLAKNTKNQIGVAGFIEQYAQQADLTSFLKKYRTDLSSTTKFTLQTLDGGSNPQGRNDAGIEANLDIQYTVGIASGVPVNFISVGENFQDGDLEGFLDIVNFILGESTPPSVLTTSYGEDESSISRALANQLCTAYAQLGARGTSILFASGDGGVSGSQSQSCSKFVPTFPSGCPFMTAVGATQLSGTTSETAASFSAGGFSNYFGVPSYQSSVVSAYVKAQGNTNSGKFNTSGRAYPDVAAIGMNVNIYSGGSLQPVSGTSCSSPIFASIVALLNDELASAGKSALGFLNPFLYANPSAFHDITSGDNPGCNTNGFKAAAGWDPVTGLGTPNYSALRTAAGL